MNTANQTSTQTSAQASKNILNVLTEKFSNQTKKGMNFFEAILPKVVNDFKEQTEKLISRKETELEILQMEKLEIMQSLSLSPSQLKKLDLAVETAENELDFAKKALVDAAAQSMFDKVSEQKDNFTAEFISFVRAGNDYPTSALNVQVYNLEQARKTRDLAMSSPRLNAKNNEIKASEEALETLKKLLADGLALYSGKTTTTVTTENV